MSISSPGSLSAGAPTAAPTTAPMSRLSRDQIERRVRELRPWFHDMDLAGVQTAPDHFLRGYPEVKWRLFEHAIPRDLTGKSVLDIGCNGGFYSMEMKRRGAARVVGIDFDDRFLAQARLAAEVNGFDDIEFRRLSVYDVAALGEKFDLVLFMGVFYHLRHPLLALDLIHENVAGDLLVFQSMQRGSSAVDEVAPDYTFWDTDHFERPGYPKMFFVEHNYCGDMTNWWIPNRAATEAMLRGSGFDIVQRAEEEVYVCRRRDLGYAPDRPWAVYPARPDRSSDKM